MRVVILGGGSAGWLVAGSLQARLNGIGPGPVQITVVSSPETPRIGVGEATVPPIRTTLANLGLREGDVMRACGATIKHGIRFDDWSGAGSSYWHPFHRFSGPGEAGAAARWLLGSGAVSFTDTVSAQTGLIADSKGPRPPGGPDYAGVVPYAYHLDAEAFADMLEARCIAQGVTHLRAHVAEVLRDEFGVAGLVLQDGARLKGDLYVDCSGFAHLLDPEGAWVDQSDSLICDRAVVMQVPHDGRLPPPFTRARALSAGWCWDIGLRHRRGRGYVYASSHIDDDVAEAELRAEEGPQANDVSARHIRFRVGRKAAPWVGNVVSIGLSAGFLEPLESTGLYLADLGARMLLEYFPHDPDAVRVPELANGFNRVMTTTHDEVMDFVALHYALSTRSDTAFWRDATDPRRRTERLVELLALWDVRPPSFVDINDRYSLFSVQNYEFILLGNGWRPARLGPSDPQAPTPGGHRQSAELVRSLPPLGVFMGSL